MSEEFELLLETLEKSLEKNGDKTITISHLINIIKLIEKKMESDSYNDYNIFNSDIF